MSQRSKFLAGNLLNSNRLRSRSRRRPATVIPPIGNAIFTASARRSGVFGVISGCVRSVIDALRNAELSCSGIAIVAAAYSEMKQAFPVSHDSVCRRAIEQMRVATQFTGRSSERTQIFNTLPTLRSIAKSVL